MASCKAGKQRFGRHFTYEMTIQLIIVLFLIVFAAGFLGYRAWRSAAAQRTKSGCGPGCGCGKV